MRWFLIVYTFLYLFLEIAFRARLLGAVGPVSDPLTIESLEIIGRLVASLGFAVLVASRVSLGKTKIRKIAYSTITYMLSFVIFFYAQKFLVEYFISTLPDDFKINALALSLYKENVYYKKHHIKGVTDTGTSSTNEKMFLATLPIVNVSNQKHLKLLDDNKKELFGANMIAKIENADKNLAIVEWQKASYEIKKVWKKYKSATQKDDTYDKFQEKVHLKKAKQIYESLDYRLSNFFVRYRVNILSILAVGDPSTFASSTFDTNGNFYKKSYLSESMYKIKPFLARSELYSFDMKKDASNAIDFINRFNEALDSLLKNKIESIFYSANMHKMSIFGNKNNGYWEPTYESYANKIDELTSNICIAKNRLPPFKDENSIKLLNSILVDKKYGVVITGTKSNKRILDTIELKDDSMSSTFIVCDTTSIEKSIRKELGMLAAKVNSLFYGFNRDIKSVHTYVKTNFGRTEVQVELQNRNIIVPKNFNTESYTSFLKYYKSSILNRKQLKLNRIMAALADMNVVEYVRKHGDFPKNLNEYEFYRTPAMQMFLKNKFPQIVQKNGYLMIEYDTGTWYKKFSFDLDEMLKEFIKKRESYRGVYLYDIYNGDIKNDEVMDVYAKSIIVPIFILFVSTIMIIFNIINLSLLCLNSTNIRNKAIAIVSIFSLFLIASYFNDTHKYNMYYKSIEDHGNKSAIFIANILQKTNPLFDYIGFANNFINRQIDVFENRYVIRKIEGHDSYKDYRIFMRNK